MDERVLAADMVTECGSINLPGVDAYSPSAKAILGAYARSAPAPSAIPTKFLLVMLLLVMPTPFSNSIQFDSQIIVIGNHDSDSAVN